MLPKAAKNRIHVTVNQLRKAGLGELLVRDESGYYLDPSVPLQRLTVDPRALGVLDSST